MFGSMLKTAQTASGAVDCEEDLISSTNPFGDGSLIYKIGFEDDDTTLVGDTFNHSGVTFEGSTEKFGTKVLSNASASTTNYCQLVTTANATSISFFIKVNSLAESQYVINGNGVLVYITSSTFYSGTGLTVDGVYYANSSPTLVIGKWYHLYLELDSQSLSMYITNVSSTHSLSTNCLIDQVEVYNRTLNSLEISKLSTQVVYSCDPTPQDYIAYYPLTGTAEDVTGNYDGTENGGLTYVDDATRGAVASFDGTNDYIGTTNTMVGYTEVTISTWVKIDSYHASVFSHISSMSSNSFNYAHSVRINTTGAIAWSGADQSTDGGTIITSSAVVPLNEWHLVTCTYSATSHDIYIDGINVASGNGGTVIAVAGNFEIGTYIDHTNYMLDGQLSSLRIYDRVLTEEEITTIYDYELVTHPIPVDDGLVAYYPLKNNSMDNWYQQFDGTDTGVTYDGTSAYSATGRILTNHLYTLSNLAGSYSLWFKKDGVGTNNMHLVAAQDGTTNYIEISNNTSISVYAGTSGYAGTGSILSNDTWYHLVVSKGLNSSMADIGIYLNTVKQTLSYSGGSPAAVSKAATLFNNGASSKDFKGDMAHVRPYSKELSQEEVTEIYNAEKGDFE